MSLSDRVTFLYRCPLAWSKLTGGDRERFCAQCEKTVTDLSAMPRREADAFLRAQPHSVCVRIVHDAAGRAVHRGESRPSGLVTAAILSASCLAGDEGADSDSGPGVPVTQTFEVPADDLDLVKPAGVQTVGPAGADGAFGVDPALAIANRLAGAPPLEPDHAEKSTHNARLADAWDHRVNASGLPDGFESATMGLMLLNE